MEYNAARVRGAAMFEEIESLPRPQYQLAVMDWDRQRRCCERAFNMGRHVVWPLCGVLKERISGWYQSFEESLQVRLHIGVGIFLYD